MMADKNCSKFVAAIVLLTVLLSPQFAAGQVDPRLTPDGFRSSSLLPSSPQITWTPPTANALGNFTLTSGTSTSLRRYVSFAFATNRTMPGAILVVDCNELNGAVILSTSKNSFPAGSGRNVVDNTLSDQVRLLSATKRDGVLTCSFSMNFTSTLDVYVQLATGNLISSSTASSLRKVYHGEDGRFCSNITIGQLLAPTTAPSTLSTSITTSTNTLTAADLTPDGFGLMSSLSATAAAGSRIVWTSPAVNTRGTFTLTSAASDKSSNRYVSFAFATGTKMVDTLTIVDCYEIGNSLVLGTSRNFYNAGVQSNVNDPSPSNLVQPLSATKIGGVMTCNFAMNFPSTLDVYVVLAAGSLAPDSNASNPRKQYHGVNGRFVSAKTIKQVLSSATATASSTTFISLAAITIRAVSWW